MKKLKCFFLGHIYNEDECLRCERPTMSKVNRELFEAGFLHANYSFHEWGELSDWRNKVKYATCKICNEEQAMMAIVNM